MADQSDVSELSVGRTANCAHLAIHAKINIELNTQIPHTADRVNGGITNLHNNMIQGPNNKKVMGCIWASCKCTFLVFFSDMEGLIFIPNDFFWECGFVWGAQPLLNSFINS
jgi:hypothetical protein